MADRIARQRAFLAEADRLKSVDRASVLMDLSRPENSAEHSWHVAVQAMVFGASPRAIRMLLVHDLVEIDVGDQPIHLRHDAAALAQAERRAARRIFGLLPGADVLLALWHEFEAAATPDAVMAKRMDHSQPMFQALLAPRPRPDHLDIVRANLTGGRAARLAVEWPEAVDWVRAVLDGRAPPDCALSRRLRFLAQADKLKSLPRAMAIADGSPAQTRAEYCWHLALCALVRADEAGPGVDVDRVIRMVLVHDLARTHAPEMLQACGDMPADAAERVFGLLPPGQATALLGLWHEFAAGTMPDAAFARSLSDHLPSPAPRPAYGADGPRACSGVPAF